MPCFYPRIAWLPPEPLEQDIFVRKDGKRIIPKRCLVFHEPIGAYRQREYQVIQIPCGRCLGCRERDARNWAIRLTCEAQLHKESCFITLTYAPQHMPKNWSLSKTEMQTFMRRLRKHYPQSIIRFFGCGEYSPSPANRPHYHICLFGTGFYEDRKPAGKSNSGQEMFSSETLDKLWGKGRAIVQSLTAASAAYCARYTSSKIDNVRIRTHTFPDGQTVRIQSEFLLMSRKPGIAGEWIKRYHSDVYRGDEGAYVSRGGVAVAPPRYFDKWLADHNAEQHELVMARRKEQALRPEILVNSGPGRLAVREAVEQARQRDQRVSRSVG